MADHVASTIYPLHRVLLKADLFACADDLSENMVQMLGLLVIGCPRLLDITPARLSKLPELVKKLLKLSESPEFSKYSDRLTWVVAKNKLNK
ncbi:hypothetical protein IWW45_008899 [Coemansia sp. RSA 485]|nr:hypothetical protein IWW45_008899 [Coemansia sp. RSA 485]